MSANDEAYMLQRNHEESMRLDTQHQFMRALSNGHLIHPSIPLHGVQAIADVGTGTGMWLRDTASQMLSSERATQSIEFWGFDISAQQFPPEESPGTKFQVHNIVDSFPPQFHEKFDVVHVRLLSYAIKAKDLEKVVDNIVQILRPGGYLQWQECDIIDVWARPETAQTRSTVAYIVSERIARGLTPASDPTRGSTAYTDCRVESLPHWSGRSRLWLRHHPQGSSIQSTGLTKLCVSLIWRRFPQQAMARR